MYDSTYGDSWGGYSVSDVTVSDQTYSDLAAGMGHGGEVQVAGGSGPTGNPWSPQAMQHDALTAGDQVPTKEFSYPTTGDYIGWWGDASGFVASKTIGGPAGGAAGSFLSGAGHALGDAYESRRGAEENGNNR